jgi:hypothetical protein
MSRLQECRRKRAVTATEIGTHTEIAWRVTAAPYFHNGAAEKGLVTQHQGDAWSKEKMEVSRPAGYRTDAGGEQ